MIILDQVQKDDSRLRVISIGILVAMLFLIGGLWRLQILAAQRYSRSETAQSVRLVRVPAVRGKILDRNGVPLAENRPSYDINLYLEELRSSFRHDYTNRALPAYRAAHGGARPRGAASQELQQDTRLGVYSNTVQSVAAVLGTNLPVSAEGFQRHYRQALALPIPVAENLNPTQMALFFERGLGVPGVDLEVQAVRTYPHGSVAAHVLGHLRRADEADNDPEPLVFRYRLRDYEGAAGIEKRFDDALRGRAGVKWLRVNSQGYRHQETIYQPTEAGANISLTLDLTVQVAAERALARVADAGTRGAAVVMDVQNGDLLALVSLPAFDPNEFLGGMSPEAFARLNDEKMTPQMNRSVSGAYAPGSIFKIIVGLAALEAGFLDPEQNKHYLGYWPMPGHSIDDLAPAGDYNFKRAFKKSSNSYFIDHGLQAGRARIVAMAKRFGLGQGTGFILGPEARGILPDDAYVRRTQKQGDPWTEGDTAQLCIGQGALTVSPLQLAVLTSAMANGGRLVKPRLVQRVESTADSSVTEFPNELPVDMGLNPRHLEVVRRAMLADVEESDGTGSRAAIKGWQVSGKTGTAEIKRRGVVIDKITWFVAFAPYQPARYAVVVVVESGASGGGTSAPVAREIFEALYRRDHGGEPAAVPRRVAVQESGSDQEGDRSGASMGRGSLRAPGGLGGQG